MIEVEVFLRTSSGNEPAVSVVRPTRVLPDGQRAGVVFRRSAYPLYRERGGVGRFYIQLSDPEIDKDFCEVLRRDVNLVWHDDGESLVIAQPEETSEIVPVSETLEWDVRTNAFGNYLLFNGGRVVVSQVLRALEATGYEALRVGDSAFVADEGVQYQRYVRLDTVDEADEIRSRFSAAWRARSTRVTPAEPVSGEGASESSTALVELHGQLAQMQTRLDELLAQREKAEAIHLLLSKRLTELQAEQHSRARKLRETQSDLRAEQSKTIALLSEIDKKSLDLLRAQRGGAEADKARREVKQVRAALIAAQTELAQLRAQSSPTPATVDDGASDKLKVLQAEIERLGQEHDALLAMVSEADKQRDEAKIQAKGAQHTLTLLRSDVESSQSATRVVIEDLENRAVSLEVLDLEIRELANRIDNLAASRHSPPAPMPPDEDDEAADVREERQSRNDRLRNMLTRLVAVAFPRLRMSNGSFDEIIDRALESDELWRELGDLDQPGNLNRSHNRIRRSEWRELRVHINHRTRVYWRPDGDWCLVHVWWKTSPAAQQRLHECLEREPYFGFGGR